MVPILLDAVCNILNIIFFLRHALYLLTQINRPILRHAYFNVYFLITQGVTYFNNKDQALRRIRHTTQWNANPIP